MRFNNHFNLQRQPFSIRMMLPVQSNPNSCCVPRSNSVPPQKAKHLVVVHYWAFIVWEPYWTVQWLVVRWSLIRNIVFWTKNRSVIVRRSYIFKLCFIIMKFNFLFMVRKNKFLHKINAFFECVIFKSSIKKIVN